MTLEKQRDAHIEFSDSENHTFIFHGSALHAWLFKVELMAWLLAHLMRVRIKRTFRNLKNRFLI